MKSEFFDVHTHVNFEAFREDRDLVISRALESGVSLVNVGTQYDTSSSAVSLAEKYEAGVYAVVGLHPVHTDKSYHDEEELGEGGKEFTSRGESFDIEKYLPLANNPKTVAIGECGLDFFRLSEDSVKKQTDALEKQIELANIVKKPLMLHVRNGSGRSAYNEAFEIISKKAKVVGDLHFFAGSIEEAKPYLDLGFSFSFTGVVTFAKNYHEIIKYLPLSRIMSETDAPYVSPVPYRGKRNEPAYVIEVVRKIAEIRGEPFEAVKTALRDNALKFFGI